MATKIGPGVLHYPIDYKDRKYSGPYWVDKANGTDPGYFVYGRSFDEYGPWGIIKIVARPDVISRKWPNWNKRVNAGWRTKREALTVCALFNKGF